MHKDFSEALTNAELISDTQFKVCGQLHDFPGVETAIKDDILKPKQSGPAADEALVKALADQLYVSFYARLPVPTSTGIQSAQRNNHRDRQHDFVKQLSESNHGVGTWEPGWMFREIESDGRISVLKNDVTFWLNKDDIRFEHDKTALAGDVCWVRIKKEYRHLMPSFYMAIGNGMERNLAAAIQWRFYWNLKPEVAARLIDSTTSLFNPLEIPFRVKVLSDPNAYHRADSGVLYIGKQDWPEVEPILHEIYAQLAFGLRHQVPRYTKFLAPGLAFAESPDNNLSFGQHRSLLVARALYFAYRDGIYEDSGRAQYLQEELLKAGVDSDRPYLTVDSQDVVAPIPYRVTVMSTRHAPVNVQANERYSFLQAAANIGEMLCKKAYWSSNQQAANWLGHSVLPDNLNKVSPCISSLNHSLYDGLGGVALYLAQLYSLTKIDSFRRTAIGALEGACLQVQQQSSQNTPLSFYSGLLGVVYSILEVSVLVNTPIFVDRLPGFFEKLRGNLSLEHGLDIISGNAGSILAFLELAQRHNIESCYEWALMLGDEIYNSAIVNNGIWTWPSQRMPGSRDPSRPLTGLSHGMAGIGLALSELYLLTQRSDCSVARYSRKFSHVNCDGSFGTESGISTVLSIC
jgi:HopA1 effector protein family/Lanthionine synthetase C-like protein